MINARARIDGGMESTQLRKTAPNGSSGCVRQLDRLSGSYSCGHWSRLARQQGRNEPGVPFFWGGGCFFSPISASEIEDEAALCYL